MSRDARFSRYTSTSNEVIHFSAVLYVIMIYSALLGVCKTQYTAGASSDQMIMKYAHDKYNNMLLTSGTCNSPACTAAWEYVLYYSG